MIKPVNTSNSQKPIGPYPQAIIANGFIFCSGTAGVDPNTDKVVDGLENQTRQVFENLNEILREAKSDLSKVVKVNIYLKNMKDFKKMNEVYEEIFGENLPAMTTIEASDLAKKDALIVVDLIALSDNK